MPSSQNKFDGGVWLKYFQAVLRPDELVQQLELQIMNQDVIQT